MKKMATRQAGQTQAHIAQENQASHQFALHKRPGSWGKLFCDSTRPQAAKNAPESLTVVMMWYIRKYWQKSGPGKLK
jgi:hypothetical protein